ncbi:MAG: hypothetical protein Q3959_02240 [Limosilactobacillus sp.]|uniref:YczE/YyaS/YitT family protein n=1 Tax=Limosilactobacillus sp. TaxID=2773925 RepID=UPI0027042368|nr:hypothetical protein [Limosilactobacillus sp.]
MEESKNRSISNIFLRTLMSFVGIALVSLGAALLRGGKVGLDPFTAVNTGMSEHLKLSLGVYQLSVNLVIFIFVLLLDRKKIGIGTVLNMVLVGFEIQWFSALYTSIFGTRLNAIIIFSNLVIGLLFFTLGSSMYMGAELGVAPYDAIAPILSNRFHTQYRTIRIAQDILFMIAAYFAAGPVGIGTVIVAFFTGPLITFWDLHVSQPMRQTIDGLDELTGAAKITYLLTNFGRSSYNLVTQSYELTNLMQLRLSEYSPKDIEDQMKITQRNMKIAEAAYKSSEHRYNMLREELLRRDRAAKHAEEESKN